MSRKVRSVCHIYSKQQCRERRVISGVALDGRTYRTEPAHIVGVFNYLTRMADGFGLLLDPQTEAAGQTGEALRRPGE